MVVVFTSQPPIEAETNLANPSEDSDEEALTTVDVAPAIVAGKNKLLTDRLPTTVSVSFKNCR